ncbi:MAG TPA: hypothetical protein VHA52_06905 [Candidatus Babeliaceae bacterium]|nr:hypothetical protein [Candidatus Babeliaceae bacterium]
MKYNSKLSAQIKDLGVLTRQGGDEDEDGGGTEANPIEPDYSDPDSEA